MSGLIVLRKQRKVNNSNIFKLDERYVYNLNLRLENAKQERESGKSGKA